VKQLKLLFISFLLLIFSTTYAIAQNRTSPFTPPEKNDSTFIVDDSPGLDTGCTYRSGGPLVFDIEITRFVGDVNQDGTLKDTSILSENGIIAKTATLTFPAFDVDYNGGGSGVNPERDVITFNGVEIKRAGTAESFLTGENNTWILNEFVVPIEIIKFPVRANSGNSPTPRKNTITIEIDQANIGNNLYGTDEYWCTSVDWAALTFNAMPPVVLIHGNGSNGGFWDRRGFTQILNEKKIPYNNSINLPTTTVARNGETLKNDILNVAKTMGVQNIQIVAHSKGGLDTREFLSSYYPALVKDKKLKIHNFITLSTPHRGSVGADYIRAIELTRNFKLENENDRTKLAWWLTIGTNQDAYNANANLTTQWTEEFNKTNNLPKNINYKSVGADADINNNGHLERNEYQEMIDESVLPNNFPDSIVNPRANTAYNALGNFKNATIRDTGRDTGFPWHTPIYELVETPTSSFQENDMMVTVNSAKFTFNFIKQFKKNHATVADQEVAREVVKNLKYAQ
jgi:triacylglycerol lipase